MIASIDSHDVLNRPFELKNEKSRVVQDSTMITGNHQKQERRDSNAETTLKEFLRLSADIEANNPLSRFQHNSFNADDSDKNNIKIFAMGKNEYANDNAMIKKTSIGKQNRDSSVRNENYVDLLETSVVQGRTTIDDQNLNREVNNNYKNSIAPSKPTPIEKERVLEFSQKEIEGSASSLPEKNKLGSIADKGSKLVSSLDKIKSYKTRDAAGKSMGALFENIKSKFSEKSGSTISHDSVKGTTAVSDTPTLPAHDPSFSSSPAVPMIMNTPVSDDSNLMHARDVSKKNHHAVELLSAVTQESSVSSYHSSSKEKLSSKMTSSSVVESSEISNALKFTIPDHTNFSKSLEDELPDRRPLVRRKEIRKGTSDHSNTKIDKSSESINREEMIYSALPTEQDHQLQSQGSINNLSQTKNIEEHASLNLNSGKNLNLTFINSCEFSVSNEGLKLLPVESMDTPAIGVEKGPSSSSSSLSDGASPMEIKMRQLAEQKNKLKSSEQDASISNERFGDDLHSRKDKVEIIPKNPNPEITKLIDSSPEQLRKSKSSAISSPDITRKTLVNPTTPLNHRTSWGGPMTKEEILKDRMKSDNSSSNLTSGTSNSIMTIPNNYRRKSSYLEYSNISLERVKEEPKEINKSLPEEEHEGSSSFSQSNRIFSVSPSMTAENINVAGRISTQDANSVIKPNGEQNEHVLNEEKKLSSTDKIDKIDTTDKMDKIDKIDTANLNLSINLDLNSANNLNVQPEQKTTLQKEQLTTITRDAHSLDLSSVTEKPVPVHRRNSEAPPTTVLSRSGSTSSRGVQNDEKKRIRAPSTPAIPDWLMEGQTSKVFILFIYLFILFCFF